MASYLIGKIAFFARSYIEIREVVVMHIYPYLFDPIYKEYIWGGRNLERLGRNLPEGKIAESWELALREEGISVICNGPLKDTLFSDVIKKYKMDIMGSKLDKVGEFPLLIKIIDANDRLSVQVHPDDDYAAANEKDRSGKHEMWYILEAAEDSSIILGLRDGIDKDDFRDSIEKGRVEECLNYVRVEKGDIIDIPPGVVHAIGKGILLAEIQQNSNNTYRVYDYERVDKNGGKRELHIGKALDVIDFKRIHNACILKSEKKSVDMIVSNKYFETYLLNIEELYEDETTGEKFHIYMFTGNEAAIEYGKNYSDIVKVPAGRTVFIPAATGKYRIRGKFTALKTNISGR